MRLLIVRHGESVWNAERLLQGQADIGLSDLGRSQAQALAATVQALKPCQVFASDLKRTRETATLLGYPDHEAVPALREIDVGDWSGRRIEELRAEDEAAFRGWRAGTFTPPGGEAWHDFKRRTAAVVSALPPETDEAVLLVAHGGVIRALLENLLDLRPAQIVPVGPGSLTVLRLGKVNGSAAARLEVFNYTPSGPVFDAPD